MRVVVEGVEVDEEEEVDDAMITAVLLEELVLEYAQTKYRVLQIALLLKRRLWQRCRNV